MKLQCKTCGSQDVEIVPDGVITIVHTLDLRHWPPDATDEDLEAFIVAAEESHRTTVRDHVKHYRRERDQRIKGGR